MWQNMMYPNAYIAKENSVISIDLIASIHMSSITYILIEVVNHCSRMAHEWLKSTFNKLVNNYKKNTENYKHT